MRVEFSLPDDQAKTPVASAEWDGHDVIVEADDDGRREALVRAFRRTPVVTNDPAYLRMGTSGDVVVQPDGLQWFRAVARTRVPAEMGLAPRFVPGKAVGGFDPAAGYRPFRDQVELLDGRSRA
jgi:hypothetical protein